MPNYIVCWNDDVFPDQLKPLYGENDITVYTKRKDFISKKSKTLIKGADGFIVLCELKWDHETDEASFSEFKGISLVQKYLRKELGVKAPVVFVSFLSPEQLVKFKKETNIVQTPALQHRFVRLPCENPIRDIKNANFANNVMRKQTDKDLAYTRMFYCDLKGLLRGLHHILIDKQEETEDEYRAKYKEQIVQMEYVIEHEFPTEKNKLLEELHNRTDLHTFSQMLIDKSSEDNIYEGIDKNEKYRGVKILYLEDDPYKGNPNRFIEYCKNIPNCAKSLREAAVYNKFFLNVMTDVNDIPKLFETEKHDYFAKYDVVICDIELRDESGMLKYLGYELIENMANLSRTPLYYIVTNMSRSVYDQVKPSVVKRIMLKSEAFGSEELIENFLYGIKEALDDRTQKNETETQSIFNYFDNYIRAPKQKSASIRVRFKNIEKEIIDEDLCLPKGLYDFVGKETGKLINFFSDKLKELNSKRRRKGMQVCDFITFNKCCKYSRERISETMKLGRKDWKKTLDMTQDPSADDLARFVKILILRRFFFYVRKFVELNKITESLNDYRKNKLCYVIGDDGAEEMGRHFTEDDLAFRAIEKQYKTLYQDCYENTEDGFLFGEKGTESIKRKQSRMNVTLLWNTKLGTMTDEEKIYEKGLKLQVVEN